MLISTNHEHKTQHIHYNSQHFVFKKTVFANNAIFSKIMSQSRLFWLIQAPNISKHMPRNGGATIKASRKTAHNKNKNYFKANRPFFSQKWRHHQKKVIALNTYIGTNVLVYERWLVLKVRYTAGWPAQHFHHSIDSHC